MFVLSSSLADKYRPGNTRFRISEYRHCSGDAMKSAASDAVTYLGAICVIHNVAVKFFDYLQNEKLQHFTGIAVIPKIKMKSV